MNSKYIELQGFLSSNTVSYKKVVNFLASIINDKECGRKETYKLFKSFNLIKSDDSSSIKELILEARSLKIEYPIIMDKLMDVVDINIGKKRFTKCLSKYEKKLRKKSPQVN